MPIKRSKKALRLGGRQQGEPSRHQRRVAAKLDLRRAGFDALPSGGNARAGFKRPGSQNLHRQ